MRTAWLANIFIAGKCPPADDAIIASSAALRYESK